MKKVVFIHQHFRTPEEGGGVRSYFLAETLANAGIEVLVIGGQKSSSYPSGQNLGFRVIHLDIPYSQGYSFFKRLRSFLGFSWQAFRVIGRLETKPDLIYAISVPLTVAITSLLAKKKWGIPFVFEIGDLWPSVPIQMGLLKNPIGIWLAKYLEKSAYKNATLISALSPDIESQVQKISPGTKTIVIPNFSNNEFFKGPATEKSGKKEILSLGYFGAVGQANGVEFLVDLVKISKLEKRPIRFHFMIRGALFEKMKRDLSGFDNWELIPFGSMEQVRDALKKIDVGIVSYSPYAILGTGSPNKLFDYLASGKPVFVNTQGWFQKTLQEKNAGFFIPYDTPEKLLDKCEDLLKNQDELKKASENAQRLARERFSKQKLLEDWKNQVLSLKPLKG